MSTVSRFVKYLRSKTVWGGVLVALPQIADVLQAGVFGPKAAALVQGVGIILGAIGVKSAISKVPPPVGQ